MTARSRGDRTSRPPVDPRRDASRADARWRIPRLAWLGLRRGRPVCAAPAVRRTGWHGAASSTRAHARGIAVASSMWSTTTSGRQGTTSASSGRTSPTATRRPGARGQPGRPRQRRGSSALHRQRPDVAARLPRRRSAAGRGARFRGYLGSPFPGAARDAGRASWVGLRPKRERDRRVRPQRPTAHAPRDVGGYGLDAQWSDDFHHALHSVLTGETSGYYADFGRLTDLADDSPAGISIRGGYSRFRGRRHGRPLPTATDAGAGLPAEPRPGWQPRPR